MLHVVSVSLGSRRRDKRVETVLQGRPIRLERLGTDGDQGRMRQLLLEMDGKVDAFGFGGTDLGIEVNGRYYPLRAAQKIVRGVGTPVVDGGGVREVVEGGIARRLEPLLPIRPRRVLFCVGVARYAMARGFVEAGYDVRFGDLAFGLGIPIFIRRLSVLHILARILLPVMARMPLDWLYPTGAAQDRSEPRFRDHYHWASLIADDFHYVKQHLPERLDGKVVLTNTTTGDDVEMLRRRGVSHLVTVTPRLDGRSFGTNVMEAALIALAGKERPLTQAEIQAMLSDEDLDPKILELQR